VTDPKDAANLADFTDPRTLRLIDRHVALLKLIQERARLRSMKLSHEAAAIVLLAATIDRAEQNLIDALPGAGKGY
jgi:hypothetical protein